ncbi:unnamed protein product, partial [Prorocentrum cordatum]
VDCDRMKLAETDDSGELREFDLAPGENGTRAATLADSATWTSEITGAGFAAWKNPPAHKKPDEDLARADEEGEGEEGGAGAADEAEGPEEDDDADYIALGMKGTPPTPAAAKAKPAAAELPTAKPAAADPGKFADEKGRAFDYKTEQFDGAMHYKKSHSAGPRVKGGSQLISFGGVRCAASVEYRSEIGRQ